MTAFLRYLCLLCPVAVALTLCREVFAQPPTAANAAKQAGAKRKSGYSRYVNRSLHFAVSIPSFWEFAVKEQTVIFAGPKDGSFTPNMVININDSGGQDTAQYAVDALKAMRKIKSLQVEEKGGLMLAGLPAYAVRVHGKVGGVADFEQQQVYCVNGKRGYILALTTNAAITSKYKPIFDKFVASFQWVK